MRAKVHVLLVEDDPGDQELVRVGFDEPGGNEELHVVDNVDDALACLRSEGAHQGEAAPNLILLDLNLPGKGGIDLLRIMKNDPKLSSLPVVVLTTSQATEDIVRCYEMGANSYVVKPLGLDKYIAAVSSIRNFWCNVASLPM